MVDGCDADVSVLDRRRLPDRGSVFRPVRVYGLFEPPSPQQDCSRCIQVRAGGTISNELIPYRTAVWGLAICFLLAVMWCGMAGMSPWLAVLELGVFIFVIAVVMARSTAEAGAFMTETTFRPVDLYRMFAPIQHLGAANLTVLAFLDGTLMRDQRGLLLTGFLDGLKLSGDTGVKRRSLLPWFIAAILLALVFAGALQIWLPYTRGANHLYPYIMQGNNVWALGVRTDPPPA